MDFRQKIIILTLCGHGQMCIKSLCNITFNAAAPLPTTTLESILCHRQTFIYTHTYTYIRNNPLILTDHSQWPHKCKLVSICKYPHKCTHTHPHTHTTVDCTSTSTHVVTLEHTQGHWSSSLCGCVCHC